MPTNFPIVGIGASAGGVEALEAFFAAMPAESGMAFVVVMHLDPTHESWLPAIIGRRTSMPVTAARDGERVEPGRIYVLAPGAIMTIAGARLHLRERGAGAGERAPVDIFFSSLAEDYGENAVGIVLSGTGSDGTLGIKAIKEGGGLTLAQGRDRTEPRFRDMPESAAATGLVDLVVPVEQMPERLLGFLRSEIAGESERIAAAMGKIHEILRGRLGHDFSEYKDKTFARRLQRRMQVLQIADTDAYVDRLRHDPDEAPHLFRDLLIGVTAFFRDLRAFEALETTVIPKMFERSGDDVRVWVPGCSTGEEVYTIAILLREHMDKLPAAPKVQLFGTDIDERALAVARAGQYPRSLLANVSPERLKRFFVSDGHAHQVLREIRDLCVFSPHSVLRDPPFSRLDLISCRNLLIYLNADLQARLIPIFHYALKPAGFLFLGLSETVTRHGDLFAPLDKQFHIYKRRDLVKPALDLAPQFTTRVRRSPWPAPSPQASGALMPNILRSANAAVMEHFAPAHVVVNAEGQVLHYSIKTGRYLEPAFGSPSRDLLAMARKGLRLDLRAALRKAVETHQIVTNDRVTMEVDGTGVQTVSLTVQPIIEGEETAFLVVFTDVGPVRTHDQAAGSVPVPERANLEHVERELQDTKQRLQGTVEELETSNEELKSSNEEMLSVNEELQSSNEELEASKEETQSINEELQTVNSELHHKIGELDQSNSDLRNIFESTQVATVFLDRTLVIRSFTRAATEIFNLIPGDVGRPLGDIANRLDSEDLDRDLREALVREQAVERRVTANDRTIHYLMRLLPYRALSRMVEGVLVTFTDITSVVASEEHQKMLTAELSHRIKNTLAVIGSIASETGAHARGIESFLETFLARLQGLAGTHELLSQSEWTDVGLRGLIERELAPYAKTDGKRLEVGGPPIALKPRAAIALGMVFHELATNSIKYGALSAPKGRLRVSWEAPHRSAPQRLELSWIESDGPASSAPIKRGFGLEFIERALQFELGGAAKIAFEKTGLECALSVPLGPDVVVSAPENSDGGR